MNELKAAGEVGMDDLKAERERRWGQTPETRVPDPEAAVHFIARVGIATVFPASPEVPNLYHAYVGDPDRPTDSKWDSPSGHVYTWRWELGGKDAGFYGTVVRKRPTFVSWRLLPAVLRLRGELRTPDELFDLALISQGAYRIAQALDESGGVLTTDELRKRAGFPTGKEQRNAYLKAVDELDSRLLLAKVFASSSGEEGMGHALVALRYPEHVEQAERMTCESALDQVLRAYLPHAVFVVPAVLARHLGLAEGDLRAALDRLAQAGTVAEATLPGYKGTCYVISEAALAAFGL